MCQRIKPSYDEIFTNISLYSKKSNRKVAEIDVLAKRDDEVHIFEVKCSYRPVKAKKQLTKIQKIVPNVNKTFFFCGESGVLERIEL